MASDSERLLQFLPFSSVVCNSFWHKLSELKIEVFALKEEPVEITGHYSNNHFASARLPACFNVDYSSFRTSTREGEQSNGCQEVLCQGTLRNTNTLSTFKEINKQSAVDTCGQKIWQDIVSGAALSNPNLLSRFLLLTFAELKNHDFYYWFAFPALVFPSKVRLSEEPKQLEDVVPAERISQLQTGYDEFKAAYKHSAFVVVTKPDGGDASTFHPLKDIANLSGAGDEIWLGFCDPSSLATNPGWPLRNLLALIAYHYKDLLPGMSVLCWRDGTRDGHRTAGHSLLLKIGEATFDEHGQQQQQQTMPKCVGWEKNERAKMGPRLVNLSAVMDSKRLAESAVDLNLKLMKWRLLPELDLDVCHSAKCLLVGAGTLGCNVARGLMAWGVRHITFVDNGRVSYSNPVRQSLYRFEHCTNGGASKADTAAQSLRDIFPGMVARSMDVRIPMPGHFVSDGEGVERDVQILAQAIQEHDVIFLLTDTRESRWLPTMLGAYFGKLVINAALGFDTYLVMRHGFRKPWTAGQAVPEKSRGILRGFLGGQQLGCYFCNDVVAPGDSTRDRTLDQQCTVTRPGTSMIASGLAVELMVSVLQHPEKGNAAAEITTDAETGPSQPAREHSPLGVVPHSIRGFLYRHQQVLPATEAFYNCTACSPLVLERYAADGYSFLQQVFNNPDFLEQVSGLAELQKDVPDVEDWDYPESSSDDADSAI